VRIEVQLFATFAQYLPPGGRDGSAVLDVPESSTPRDIARQLGLPNDLDRVLLVNGRDADPDQRLAPDDVLTLFPPLAGGK
jgi:molybdopterin converting factor small subunit